MPESSKGVTPPPPGLGGISLLLRVACVGEALQIRLSKWLTGKFVFLNGLGRIKAESPGECRGFLLCYVFSIAGPIELLCQPISLVWSGDGRSWGLTDFERLSGVGGFFGGVSSGKRCGSAIVGGRTGKWSALRYLG